METIFRKILVSERLPSKECYYFTNAGCNYYDLDKMAFSTKESFFSMDVTWWLEEIEIPSEEEIQGLFDERIKELRQADAEFCKIRWDVNEPKWKRDLHREESNNVTFSRQELESMRDKILGFINNK